MTIPNSVTSIGYAAFADCTSLTSVTIPNSVTSIGDAAFSGCSGLTSVTIPNSVTSIGDFAFASSGLTSVTIPNSVTSIGNYAFLGTPWYNNQPDGLVYAGMVAYKYKGTMPNGTSIILKDGCTGITASCFSYCTGLTSVTIPNSVTSIGSLAFYFCSGLTSVVVESGNTKYDSRNNCNAIIETATNTLISGCKNTIIPNSVTSVGEGAFANSSLSSVTIPNSVTSIGNYAFEYCSGLTSVTIGNSVTSIGNYAFYGCSGLTGELTIPNSVTSIGWYAFYGCSGLTSVTIPNSVTSIGEEAFSGCTRLTSVNISDLAAWCNIDFYRGYSNPLYYAHNLYLNGSKVTNLVIPSSVTTIKKFAFRGCSGLTSVNIPNSVTSIGWGAFSGCSGLTSVTIPNSVTSIGNYAFSHCDGLTSVTIPNSVTSIGDYAFAWSGLTSVVSKIKNPQNVYYDSNIFYDVPTSQCSLYVPHGKYDIYRTTSPWSEFSTIIEMDPTGDVNDDGKVNVTDYVATAGYILEMDPQPFYLEECDFNDSGTVSVSDLVGVATRVLSFEGAPMLTPAVGMTEAPSIAMAADVNGRDGSYEVAINLSNNIDLTALQMDLNLPAGLTLVDVSLSDRASASHQVAFNQLNNGDYRLLASSPLCKSFTGNDGAVLTLTLAGEPCGDGIIRNIELATPRAASYKIDDIELHFTSPTGVENMTAATATRIYSDGSNIIIDSPVNGTAQIVLPNGISKTVTVTAGKNIFPAPASGMVIVKMGNSIKKLQIK